MPRKFKGTEPGETLTTTYAPNIMLSRIPGRAPRYRVRFCYCTTKGPCEYFATMVEAEAAKTAYSETERARRANLPPRKEGPSPNKARKQQRAEVRALRRAIVEATKRGKHAKVEALQRQLSAAEGVNKPEPLPAT